MDADRTGGPAGGVGHRVMGSVSYRRTRLDAFVGVIRRHTMHVLYTSSAPYFALALHGPAVASTVSFFITRPASSRARCSLSHQLHPHPTSSLSNRMNSHTLTTCTCTTGEASRACLRRGAASTAMISALDDSGREIPPADDSAKSAKSDGSSNGLGGFNPVSGLFQGIQGRWWWGGGGGGPHEAADPRRLCAPTTTHNRSRPLTTTSHHSFDPFQGWATGW